MHKMPALLSQYITTTSMLALDQPQCLPMQIRTAFVTFMGRVKRLQTDWASLMFNVWGFGVFGDVHSTEYTRNDFSRDEDMTYVYMWSGAAHKMYNSNFKSSKFKR